MKITAKVMGAAIAASLLLMPAVLVRAEQYSHVRIVRLSFAQGTVTIQRPDVSEWAKAPVNTPIQEGFKVSTGGGSFAEVEFENGSTARVGEASLLEFNQLALTASGDKINHLTLKQGYATFHVFPALADDYEVKAQDATLKPKGKTEFRADLNQGKLRVEVFRGSVDVSGAKGSATLAKNQVLELAADTEQAFQISHGITKDEWDTWVAERDRDLQADNRAPSPYRNGPAYGWSDLNDYGNWSYYPGYGYGWAPYTTGLWSPFSFGQWAWYPSFGYTWIGYEPWGWLPYHYGNWLFDPAAGWFWIPGGFANGWYPATVNWYQGPGWVGWAPSSTGGGSKPGSSSSAAASGTGQKCPPNGCIMAVTTEAFSGGARISPGKLLKQVDVATASLVPQPSIQPGRLALLPGTAMAVAPSTQALTTSRTGLASVPGARFGYPASSAAGPTSSRASAPARAFQGRSAPAYSSHSQARSGSYSSSFGSVSSGSSGSSHMGGSSVSVSSGSLGSSHSGGGAGASGHH